MADRIGVRMRKIYYLGYYETAEYRKNIKNISPASANKMDYIISAVERNNVSVEVLSPTVCNAGKKYRLVSKKSNIKLFWHLPLATNKLVKLLNRYFILFQLYFYILKNIGKNDTILVYHGLTYSSFLAFAKKIKKFNLILEVEEIYSDLSHLDNERKIEEKIFSIADSYLFSTELLNEKLNKENKPYCVIYGTYQTEDDRDCKFNDGKIHAVYAGTFDSRKGGALAAISSAEFLSSDYHIHIIGFGTPEDTEKVKKTIEEVLTKTDCAVTYDGLLSGEDFIRFLQSCHMGLSTQNPDAEYNDTSFPSKVLTYMANGLQVVSANVSVVKASKINDFISYYNSTTGAEIAEAIRNNKDKVSYDSRKMLTLLDENFVNDISHLIQGSIL